jgi:hypothetical protein
MTMEGLVRAGEDQMRREWGWERIEPKVRRFEDCGNQFALLVQQEYPEVAESA